MEQLLQAEARDDAAGQRPHSASHGAYRDSGPPQALIRRPETSGGLILGDDSPPRMGAPLTANQEQQAAMLKAHEAARERHERQAVRQAGELEAARRLGQWQQQRPQQQSQPHPQFPPQALRSPQFPPQPSSSSCSVLSPPQAGASRGEPVRGDAQQPGFRVESAASSQWQAPAQGRRRGEQTFTLGDGSPDPTSSQSAQGRHIVAGKMRGLNPNNNYGTLDAPAGQLPGRLRYGVGGAPGYGQGMGRKGRGVGASYEWEAGRETVADAIGQGRPYSSENDGAAPRQR
jgi:hypothetical protein